VRDPQSLVVLHTDTTRPRANSDNYESVFSYLFIAICAPRPAFPHPGARRGRLALAWSGNTESASAIWFGNYFQTLGVGAALGAPWRHQTKARRARIRCDAEPRLLSSHFGADRRS